MNKKIRTSNEFSIVKEFDSANEIFVEPKVSKSKKICIRLPVDFLTRLKKVSQDKGYIGYQQIIKIYISDGLYKDEKWKD